MIDVVIAGRFRMTFSICLYRAWMTRGLSAALIAALSVKPLKQTPERLVEGFQVCSITHPARQP